jgi:EAL domain-containing protein (putative c-di-GMP-specific phosphodiesterase class I)
MGVNLSARQLRDADLLPVVREALADAMLPPEALCLELTESLLADDPSAAASVLTALRQEGVQLSIDDFGTGYSSLSYLKSFPVNTVKIDKSFVDGLEHADSADESLIAAIVAMSRALGLTTVAEGVETKAQEARLRALGCGVGQGYLYSRPVPSPDLMTALQGVDFPVLTSP